MIRVWLAKTQGTGRMMVPAGSRIVAAGGWLVRPEEGLFAQTCLVVPAGKAPRASMTPPGGKLVVVVKAAAILAQMSAPENALASIIADDPSIVVPFSHTALSPWGALLMVWAFAASGATEYNAKRITVIESNKHLKAELFPIPM